MTEYLALLLALVGLGFTQFERRDRQKESADDRRLRKDELNLLSRQIEGEDADRAARQRSRLTVEYQGATGGERHDTFDFVVSNAGPAPALDVRLYAMRGDEVVAESTPIGQLDVAPRYPRIAIPRAESRVAGLEVEVSWRDGAGEHRELRGGIEPL
jgi:hypothetical protein